MALHHFKKDVFLNSQQGNTFGSSNRRRNSLAMNHQSSRQPKSMMLGGINLGDVLKQTIKEEMNKMRKESSHKWFRNGGS